MILMRAEQSAGEISEIFGEFQFDLKLRVESSAALWGAAAERCMQKYALSADEVVDLIGPVEDPSIEDCLMMLTLPAEIPGCAMLDVSLDKLPSDQGFAALRKARGRAN
jgi:hypothetical protein